MSKEKTDRQETAEGKIEEPAVRRSYFDQLMLGHRRPVQEQEKESEQDKEINYDEFMHHVNRLMVSLDELKPLFKKVTPYIDKFMEKK